jgi:hypothetical protein
MIDATTRHPLAEPVWDKVSVDFLSPGKIQITRPDGTKVTVSLAAGLTQTVPLFTMPKNTAVLALRQKVRVAAAGVATLTDTLGVTGAVTFFDSTAYDLKGAPSDTNIQDNWSGAGNNTVAAIDFVAALTATVDNLDQLTAIGFDVWVLTTILPTQL